MPKSTSADTKGHHWFDDHALNEMPLIKIAYGDFTTPMEGKQHVVAHRDIRLFGWIGAVARYDVNNMIIGGKSFLMF